MAVGGLSRTGIGAIGGSIDGVGVYGITTRAVGVWAQTLAPRTRWGAWTLGLYAASPGAAAVFDGHVIVRGDLIVDQNHSLVVSTPGNKYGAVKFSDGSQRLVCAIESPEAWFEDFGEASLVKGKAHVALDPDFARTVDVRRYHVFLTPYGENAGLYVARRTRNGFDVAERKPGKSDLRFSWRVVSRPKSAKHKRFAKTTIQQTVERVHAAVARAKKDPKIDAALPRLDDFRVRKAAKVLKVPKLPESLMKVPSPDERRARMHAQLERARNAQRSGDEVK
jgi:hypothetical protein